MEAGPLPAVGPEPGLTDVAPGVGPEAVAAAGGPGAAGAGMVSQVVALDLDQDGSPP